MKSQLTPSAADRDVERFDEWAATYDGSLLQRLFFVPIHTRILDLLARESPEDSLPGRILDVGCGTGRLLRAASVRWPQAELLGADPAANMVAEAQRLSPTVRVELAPAESLPFSDESVDVVTSSLSFHHWADQRKGIEEITRVLRPGGLFCLADHTFLPARMSGERPRNRGQLRALMKDAGLDVVRQRWIRMPFVLLSLARKS